jgi:exosortase
MIAKKCTMTNVRNCTNALENGSLTHNNTKESTKVRSSTRNGVARDTEHSAPVRDGIEYRMVKLAPSLKFVFLCGISLAVWWHPLIKTFALALRNDAYTHIFLILPISTALVLLRWKSLEFFLEPSIRIGSALLVAAVLIAGVGKWGAIGMPPDVQLSVSMLALVTWWLAAFVLCFGIRVSRLLLFPLCFLLWLAPIPQFALNRIVGLLQRGSALTAHLLLTASGVQVTQDGFVLSIPGLSVEVAKECSSIRSSLMLVVTSMVLSQLFLRSKWRKVAIVLTAIPLSVAKNGLRIFTLSMLATRVDPSFIDGWLHHRGGILFFALSLVALCVLIWSLRNSENNAIPQFSQMPPKRASSPQQKTALSSGEDQDDSHSSGLSRSNHY